MAGRGRRGVTVRALAAAFALATAPAAGAQTDPAADWRTIRTEHFRVHFTPPLEEQARRAADNAERAWAALARELVPPRGTVDLVVADDVDFTNGFATTFPSNRIVVYAHPPVDARSLRFYDDWNELVVTHELVHVFHLDRTRGWWRAAQWVFGRNPLLFPHGYSPAWLVEGLAVYYESRITGSGRLEGAEHRMLARASAREGGVPRLDELSLATSRYPGGQGAYAYGSLLFEHLARTRGAGRVGEYVERAAGNPVPFFGNVSARRAFGISFGAAWAEFRDSVARAEAGGAREPLPGWRDLTTAGRGAAYPRWLDSSRVLFGASTGRETPAAYVAELDGGVRRVGRRNGVGTNAPLPGGGLLFAQLEHTDAHHVRSDLWTERRGRTRRLTRGARLAHPDVRADGRIVAVQAVPAGTRLVLVSPDGRERRPITEGGPDEQWTEPRWSPDGGRIAAVRWRRGGLTDVVVLDTAGRVERSLAGARAVNASPAWGPDGRAILFASDRDGVSRLYVVSLDDSSGTPRRLPGDAPGLFQPAASPGGARLAAVRYGARGEYVGVAPLDTAAATADTAASRPAVDVRTPGRSDAPARAYRPWGQLLPRYWMPFGGSSAYGGALLGAATSGSDVVGRHRWGASASYETAFGDVEGDLSYRYAGLGDLGFDRTVLQLSASRDYQHTRFEREALAGDVEEEQHRVAVSAAMDFPGFRRSSFVSLGMELERRDASGSSPELVAAFPALGEARDFLGLVVQLGASTTQRPALAISPEDGASVGLTLRERRRRDEPAARTQSAVGSARLYKSLDLPGFAHHVIALRLAGGATDRRARDLFSAGGTGGGSLELVPGVVVGDAPRPFGVRGFVAGSQRGTRAAAAAGEYRVPLVAPSRGLGLVPVFVDRASLSAFADGAAAWCHGASRFGGCRPGSSAPGEWMASVGSELVVDFALQYDVPYRARVGLAHPVRTPATLDPRIRPARVSAYLTFGTSF